MGRSPSNGEESHPMGRSPSKQHIYPTHTSRMTGRLCTSPGEESLPPRMRFISRFLVIG